MIVRKHAAPEAARLSFSEPALSAAPTCGIILSLSNVSPPRVPSVRMIILKKRTAECGARLNSGWHSSAQTTTRIPLASSIAVAPCMKCAIFVRAPSTAETTPSQSTLLRIKSNSFNIPPLAMSASTLATVVANRPNARAAASINAGDSAASNTARRDCNPPALVMVSKLSPVNAKFPTIAAASCLARSELEASAKIRRASSKSLTETSLSRTLAPAFRSDKSSGFASMAAKRESTPPRRLMRAMPSGVDPIF